MELLEGVIDYIRQNQAAFWLAARQHMGLCLAALGAAVALCLPIGVWAAKRGRAGEAVIQLFGALRVIPSLVILFVALPYLGIGWMPAFAALTALACPPVLVNTAAGLRGVDRAVVEAAVGAGMTPAQTLLRVELPLAAAAILTGIRIAAVEVISSATLAALIGAGGFGDFITRGFALFDARIMLAGALPVTLLALGAELGFALVIRPFRQRALGA